MVQARVISLDGNAVDVGGGSRDLWSGAGEVYTRRKEMFVCGMGQGYRFICATKSSSEHSDSLNRGAFSWAW